MNDVVTRVVYMVYFKDTFNYNIFQILYYSMMIYKAQKNEKIVAILTFTDPK